MKKILSITICLLMIFALLVSCGGNNEDTSSIVGETSETVSSSDEQSAEESSEADLTKVDKKMISEIDSFYTGELYNKNEYTDISSKIKYTYNLSPYKNYGDEKNNKLTDGEESGIDDDTWVGFLGKDDIVIDIDLKSTRNDIGGVSLDFLYAVSQGRNIAKTLELWASTDGENYTRIATNVKYPGALSGAQVFSHTVYTNGTITASHLRLVAKDLVSVWTFIDTLKVYTVSEVKEESSDGYYINEDMPIGVVEKYWSESEEDYEKRQNLIRGLGQRIYAGAHVEDAVKTEYYNTPASSQLLTDGKTGGTAYNDSAYFHITKALNRSIVYDIGKLSAVDSATVGIYVYDEYGITYPNTISVFLSEDGKNWQEVKAFNVAGIKLTDGKRNKIEIKFDKTYIARFVKFFMDTPSHVWLDELEVFGTKKISSEAVKLDPQKEAYYERGYNTPDALDGYENILLAYHYQNTWTRRTTKDDYMPYVGYYDTDGNLKDYFFDAYLYLPCNTTGPSGAKFWSSSSKGSDMNDWLDYDKDLFMEDRNLHALNEAVEETSKALGDDDYKVGIFLTTFLPSSGNYVFGDVDGDGKGENCSKLEDRKKIIKWWIDREIAKFNEGNFENLDFKGFYWYDEDMNPSNPVLKYAINYIHELGYYIIWIPYYQASGFANWKEIGFDAANMQPNYMFTESAPERRVYDNANLTRTLGMGVEIEIDGKAVNTAEYRERYLAYLRVGVETGYMKAIKMYYQDAFPGIFYTCYKSTNPSIRALYDYTYLYAKGKLSGEVGEVETTEFTTSMCEKIEAEIKMKDGMCLGTKLTALPKYGSLAISDNGFIYTPVEGFAGTDSFVISVSDGLVYSPITFTVTVNE